LTNWSSKIPGDRAIGYDELFAGVRTMPKFFFNFRNANIIAKDEFGVDLPSLEDARQAALDAAREIVAEDIKANSSRPVEAVIVTDEDGRELLTVSARDVLPDALKMDPELFESRVQDRTDSKS
jgi:hypothetical protein